MHLKTTSFIVFFVAVFLLFSLVLGVALKALFAGMLWHNAQIFGERFTLSTLLAAAISAAFCFYTASINSKSRLFVEQCIVELEKIAWPTWQETRGNTVVVIVTSIIAALILGVFDSVFSWLTNHSFLVG